MIPHLLDKNKQNIGTLIDCISGYAIEVRNGMCEIEIIYPIFSSNWDKLERGNIIIADVNDTIKGQMFRIYRIGRVIAGRISIYGKHISYDLGRDMIEGLEIENQSCEYCLNEIFKQSHFSRHYKGYSNIVEAQNYKIGAENIIRAIGGAQGSILDTFGNGAEILRDNENIHILSRRGRDNGVTIEYAKNLTGFEDTIDDSDMITRIRAVAKYSNENNEELQVVTYVDSPRIANYETPFISEIDFSDKFKEGETPTIVKLKLLAEKYFLQNKCDIPKLNYKIEFIPLSNCLGYEGLEDKIELCDTVTIIDNRYKLNTQAKVIKAKYNFLIERYESIELGEPKTSLGDLVGGGGSNNGGSNGNGSGGNNKPEFEFPDTLPSIPELSVNVQGFASVELRWTYENKVYYEYELYASKIRDFSPNSFDLIFKGKGSTFLHVVKPSEIWYYRVRAVNSHGKGTDFSTQVIAETRKIENLENYVENMAIGDALIGSLSLDRGWVGKLSATYLDVKGNFSVTNGNGKRTFDIDSNGDVNLDVATLKIKTEDVTTDRKMNAAIDLAKDEIKMNIGDIIEESKFGNVLINSTPPPDGQSLSPWKTTPDVRFTTGTSYDADWNMIRIYNLFLANNSSSDHKGVMQNFAGITGQEYTIKIVAKKGTTDTAYSSSMCVIVKHLDSSGNFVNTTRYTAALKSEFETFEFKGTLKSGENQLLLGADFPQKFNFAIQSITLTTMTGNGVTREEFAEIKVETKKIESTVKSVDSRLGTAESTITQQANQIKTKVDVNGVKSTIEQNPNSVKVGFNAISDVFEINANEFISRASNGNKSLVFRNGKMYTYNPYNDTNIGHFGIGKWINTSTYGLTINQDSGTFVSIGELSNGGSTYTSKFAVNHGGIPGEEIGVNIYSTLNLNNNNVVGNLNLAQGYTARFDNINNRSNPSNANGYINCYSNLNMQNWKIINAQIQGYSLEENVVNFTSENLEENLKLNKNLENTISVSGKASIKNGSCIVELPQGYPISTYEVFLQAKGRNTVYLMQENDDSFTVEADVDCEFNYKIELKLIDINRYSLKEPVQGEEIEKPKQMIVPIDMDGFWELYKKRVEL